MGNLPLIISVVVGLIALGMFVKVFRFFQNLFGFGSKEKPLPTQDVEKKQSEMAKISVPTSQLKHPMAAYQAAADRLEAAMNGYGASAFACLDNSKGWNAAELTQIYKMFGWRKHESWLNDYEGNLFVWFDQEFNAFPHRDIYEDLRKIWTQTGFWPNVK